MFLKPIKTYGKEFQAKIYKHYVEIVKQNKLGINKSDYTHYAVYKDKESTTRLYGFDLSILQSGTGNGQLTKAQITDASLETNYKEYKIYVGDVIYFPYKDKFGEIRNSRPIFYTLEEFTKISALNELTEHKEISKDIELNKYFYHSTFNYMPIDDVNDNTTQYVKGAIMREETRSIKWEIDNVPLEPNDIVVIDKKAYLVEDVLVNQRVGMNVRKTYTATLLKVGV